MKNFRITHNFIRSVIGPQPANPQLVRDYLEKKMTTGRTGMSADVARQKLEEEIANAAKDPTLAENLENLDDIVDRGLSVFHRDSQGRPSISDIQVRGFMKNAFAFVAMEEGLIRKKPKVKKVKKGKKAAKAGEGGAEEPKDEAEKEEQVIEVEGDTYGQRWYMNWISDRLRFYTQYAPIPVDLSIIERPLRAETQQGPRVAIAASEIAFAPFSVTFDVGLVDSVPTEWLVKILDRGLFRGISQWANAQWGTFVYRLEALKEAPKIIVNGQEMKSEVIL